MEMSTGSTNAADGSEDLLKFQERMKIVDQQKIRPHGNLPKPFLGQLLAPFDPIEEMELMQATIDSPEFCQNYTAIYNNLAVIGGLCLAFSTNTEAASVNPDVETIWGSNGRTHKAVSNAVGVIQNIVTIVAFITISHSMFMSIMLSQIPSHKCTQFIEMIGLARTQSLFIIAGVLLFLFLLVGLLNASMQYSTWVTVSSVIVFLVLYLIMSAIQKSIQPVRLELLREEHESLVAAS